MVGRIACHLRKARCALGVRQLAGAVRRAAVALRRAVELLGGARVRGGLQWAAVAAASEPWLRREWGNEGVRMGTRE
eukprot:146466-Chlamydomonas_euryale.AAC.1